MLQELKGKFTLVVFAMLSAIFVVLLVSYYLVNHQDLVEQHNVNLRNLSQRMYYSLADPQINRLHGFNGWEDSSFFVVFAKKNRLVTDIRKHHLYWELSDSEIEGYVHEALGQWTGGSEQLVNTQNHQFRYLVVEHPEVLQLTFISNQMLRQNIMRLQLYTMLAMSLAGVIFLLIGIIVARMSLRPLVVSYARKQQFLQDASHEIKTPLTSIVTSVEVLRGKYPEDKWVNYIEEEARRLKSLTEDLLFLAKDDRYQLVITRNEENLSELVTDFLLIQEALLFEHHHPLVMLITEGIFFSVDKQRFQQLLHILVDNADKYAKEGSEIIVSLKKEYHRIILEVSNEVEKFPTTDLEKIFQRFYRVDMSRNRKFGGSGLGLSIAKMIVERHQGKISAQLVEKMFTIRVEFIVS